MVDASMNSLNNNERSHFQTEIGLSKAQTQLLANEGKQLLTAQKWVDLVGRSIDSEQFLKASKRKESQVRKSTWEWENAETTATSNHQAALKTSEIRNGQGQANNAESIDAKQQILSPITATEDSEASPTKKKVSKL